MKDTMSIKINFMHYMKWRSKRVTLPVVLEEYEMIYTFLLLFSFQKVNSLPAPHLPISTSLKRVTELRTKTLQGLL